MLSQSAEWLSLKEHREKTSLSRLSDMFAADKNRAKSLSFSLGGFHADFSRCLIDKETVALLINLAEARGLPQWRESMFSGEKINNTENRAVLHTALRDSSGVPIIVDGKNIKREIAAIHEKTERFANDVLTGKITGATGKSIKRVVNIGIGGSDLGPRLVAGALRKFSSGIEARFSANVDASEITDILEDSDPETTIFIVASKTFTTAETLLNAKTARRWLADKLGAKAVSSHFMAVSANLKAVSDFGIDNENVFPMWDWVGGRYSLWSSVGLSCALTLGWNNFRELLRGAETMDNHFRNAPLSENIPALHGLIGLWHRNFCGANANAILPYCERLRDLPRFLQQLEMESNGKSATRDGEPVDCATAPVIFGECGTVGQHSFHQWLHQGTGIAPADFIGIGEDATGNTEHHRVLSANMRAQAEALAFGKVEDNPAKTNAGNKPSTTFVLDKLNPKNLGMLLAMYEHKVFVQGIIWGINSFDQFGVELGKTLANAELKK